MIGLPIYPFVCVCVHVFCVRACVYMCVHVCEETACVRVSVPVGDCVRV